MVTSLSLLGLADVSNGGPVVWRSVPDVAWHLALRAHL